MAIEYHLKFGSIKGESAATKHKEEIELLSWSWGACNPTTIVGAGMSAGKVSMSDLSFTKHVDEAILYCSKQTGGKTPEDFVTIKFKEVYVSSYQTGGSSGEDVGSESISITYGVINFDYKVQDKAGTLTSAGNVEYDLRKREQTA